MNERDTQKWGNFKLSDEQVERINNGDVEAFNLFFLENLPYIETRCRKRFLDKHRVDDFYEGVSASYVDLRDQHFNSAQQLEAIINKACIYSSYGSYQLVRKGGRAHTYISLIQPHLEYECAFSNWDKDDKSKYALIDRFGKTSPSPAEEIIEEERLKLGNDVDKLCEILKPFFPPALNEVLPYFLQGYDQGNIATHLGLETRTVEHRRRKIRHRLILNYDKILNVLGSNGYDVSYFEGTLPDDYEHLMSQITKERLAANKYNRERRARLKAAAVNI